jgi:hypothetical protein
VVAGTPGDSGLQRHPFSFAFSRLGEFVRVELPVRAQWRAAAVPLALDGRDARVPDLCHSALGVIQLGPELPQAGDGPGDS